MLASLESLMARPLPTLGGTAGAAALFPRPAPPVVAVCSVTLRVPAAPLVDFALSTIFVRMLAAPPEGTGAVGLRGETGRARRDFPGDTAGRTGERGSVREFADRGERTWDGWTLDVVRVGGAGGPRGRFFGFSMSSFSLSVEDTSSLSLSVRPYQIRVVILTSAVLCHAEELDWCACSFASVESGLWTATEAWLEKFVLLIVQALKQSRCTSRAIPQYSLSVAP